MEFLQKIPVWFDTYIWANAKILGGCVGVLASAMVVHMAGFGDFFLGLVEHSAWPLVILILGLRFGPKVLKIIRKFLKENDVEELSVGGAKVKARRRDVDEQAIAAISLGIASDDVTKDLEDHPFQQLLRQLIDRMVAIGLDLEFLEDGAAKLGVASYECARQLGIEFVDIPVVEGETPEEVNDWYEKFDPTGVPNSLLMLAYGQAFIAARRLEIEADWDPSAYDSDEEGRQALAYECTVSSGLSMRLLAAAGKQLRLDLAQPPRDTSADQTL